MTRRSRFYFLGASLIGAGAHAQTIREVGPGRAFAQIADAVNASAGGDRVLVYPAATPYVPFTVTRGVRITCRPGVAIEGFIRGLVFDGVPAGETASLSGASLTVRSSGLPPWPADPVITVRNSPGVVTLEECQLTTTGPFDMQRSGPQLQVVNATVLVTRCRLSGALGAPAIYARTQSVVMLSDCGRVVTNNGLLWHVTFGPQPSTPGSAIDVAELLLVLDRTSVQGADGWGMYTTSTTPRPGSDALRTILGEVHLAGPLVLQGGRGGDHCADSWCNRFAGSDGGPALRTASATVYMDQATLTGGAGGPGNPPGNPGLAYVGPPPIAARLPSLVAGPFALPGGALQLDAFAAPGSLLYLCLNFAAVRQPIAGLRGMLIPRLDARLFVIGPILVDGSGSMRWSIPVPNDPGMRGLVLFAQTAGIDPAAFPLAFFSAAVTMTVGF